MKIWYRLPLAARITLPICFVLVSGLAVSTTLTATKTSNEMMKVSMDLGREATGKGEAAIRLRFETAYRVAHGLAVRALGLKARQAPREELARAAIEAAEANLDMLGVWFVFAPDAYDGQDKDHIDPAYLTNDGRGLVMLYAVTDGEKAALEPTIAPMDDVTTQEYFSTAFNSGQDAVSDPYVYPINGKDVLMTSVTAPIIEGGKTIGVVGVDISLDHLNEELGAIKPLGDGSIYLITPGGVWVSSENPEWIGKTVKDTDPQLLAPIQAAMAGKATETADFSEARQTTIYRLFDPVSVTTSGKPWVLVTNLVGQTIAAPTRSILAETIVTAVILVTFLVGAMIVLIRALASNPVRRLAGVMGKLASGDKSVAVEGADREDEIGAMAKAIQVFKDSALEMDRLKAEQEEAAKRAAMQTKAAMAKLASEFESSVGGIVNMVSSAAAEMQTTAASMTATAEETSRQSTAVAAASEEASTNVQTVASASEELSASISEISRQVSQSSSISGKAVVEAERTNLLVKGLVEAAQKIGAVTSLINDIASQTNLLALNATIEAARAGEAGKGFAVVASEVKSLANQTARATEEIGAQIAAMQSATGDTVTAIGGIGATIAQINDIATAIAAAVEEQGAATLEIARNVQQAAAGTQQVSGNIASVTRAAGETGASATHVLGAAGELSRQAEQLRRQVGTFLQAVRAA